MEVRPLAWLVLTGLTIAAYPTAAQAGLRESPQQTRTPDREMRLRAMDRDNDGVITRAEWLGNAQGFRRRDWNGDGVLSGDEVRQNTDAQRDGGDELVAVFQRADTDDNRRLSRGEWYGDSATFDRLDRDRDGAISRAEFMGEERSLTRATFAERDRNRNGVITPNEWNDDLEEFRRRDSDRDGVLTREEYRQDLDGSSSPAFRAGRDRGLADGRQAGREDRTINGGRWDLDGQRELETADAGYSPSVGSREEYQAGYREGFRTGYREGFGRH